MLILREATFDDLPTIRELEARPEIAPFVHGYQLETHRLEFAKDEITYVKFALSNGVFAGYSILVEHQDVIELRRIALGVRDKGMGGQALRLIEDFCRDRFTQGRIRLDVMEKNARAIHLYEKSGYGLVGEKMDPQGEKMRLYEKPL